jgi:hypothetical protein
LVKRFRRFTDYLKDKLSADYADYIEKILSADYADYTDFKKLKTANNDVIYTRFGFLIALHRHKGGMALYNK